MNNNYNEYINSIEWYKIREQIISRCNNICENCRTNKVQHVHHLTYERLGKEHLEDLQGLCLKCHQLYHPDKKLKREYLLIKDICRKLNIALKTLKEILEKEGLVEKIPSTIYRSRGGGPFIPFDNSKNKPTTKACNNNFCKKKRKSQTYKWDLDLLRELIEKYK